MAKLTPDQRAALKASHGDDILFLSAKVLPDEDFVFRRPGSIEFDAFMATLSDRATKVGAHRQLAGDLRLHPSEREWAEMSERLPGLAHRIGMSLAEAAGMEADVVVGKD